MSNYETKTGVYTRNGKEFDFEFYTYLSARQKIEFVNSVTNTIVDEYYNSIIRDLIFNFYLVEIMTDVDTSEIEKTDDTISAIEDFLAETNIVDIVMENAEDGIIYELYKAVELNIEYKTGIHNNPINESLSSLIDTLEKKVENLDVDSMMDMAQALSGVSGELTAGKMVEAYANSDVMKERYKELLWDNQK